MRIKPDRFRSVATGISIWTGLLLTVAFSLPAHAETERWAELEKCELTDPSGHVSVEARCGTLSVPEDHSAPDGKQIELAWAVIPARVGNFAPDPVVFLAGGPGQSARDVAPSMEEALRNINRTRDLIFLDQRGTGGSNALTCDFEGFDYLTEPDWDALNRQLRECMDGNGADLRHYTTADGADDLERLRQHIGMEQLNLIGGSYGTRMAQVYLRRYPEQVRSIVIDGVVPTRLILGSEHAAKLDQSLEKLFTACRSDEQCNEQFPDLSAAFEELKGRYAEQPVTISLTHPRTGVAEELLFTDEMLASALRFLAYSPRAQMMIPYLVHEASTTGRPERLASQAVMQTGQLTDAIAIGLNYAVGCSEDWPHWPADHDDSGTLLGNSMRDLYAQVCAWWPANPVGRDFHQPFESDVPILILSGELDPVTPPEYGDEAARQFANSVHLIAEGRGHIVMGNVCISRIATAFVEAASVDDLDTECMQSIGPEPFFLNLLGPSP